MDNPFSTKFWALGVIPFQFSEPDESIDRLLDAVRQFPICQIVGPHGSGKSTLLLELRKRCETSGEQVKYLFFNDQKRHIPNNMTFHEKQMLFVDGFEQLSLFRQFWLRFRAQRLVLTTHYPVFFVPVLYRTKPQFTIFAQIVRQMVPNPPAEAVLKTVYERSGGNFRNAFLELYDLF